MNVGYIAVFCYQETVLTKLLIFLHSDSAILLISNIQLVFLAFRAGFIQHHFA